VWSHPLESNQNLSGFSRARRPTTQEWDTSAACADHLDGSRRPHRDMRRRSSSSFFSCQRAVRRAHLGPSCVRFGGARTSGVDATASYAGAPIAIRDLESDRESQSHTILRSDEEARNVEGPPGIPWAALPYETCGDTLLVWGASAGTVIELPRRDVAEATTHAWHEHRGLSGLDFGLRMGS
jgi:hypothetical protein